MEKLTELQITPFLPHKLQSVHYFQGEALLREVTHHNVSCYIDGSTQAKILLHNIDCLTKTIQHEGTQFIPIVELAKIFQRNIDWGFVVDKAVFSHWKNSSKLNFWYCNRYKSFLATRENKFLGKWAGETITKVNNQYQLFQKLAEWHIDFLGLIEKGLAIDKNTLK